MEWDMGAVLKYLSSKHDNETCVNVRLFMADAPYGGPE